MFDREKMPRESFMLIVPTVMASSSKHPVYPFYFTALERIMQFCCRACTIAVTVELRYSYVNVRRIAMC